MKTVAHVPKIFAEISLQMVEQIFSTIRNSKNVLRLGDCDYEIAEIFQEVKLTSNHTRQWT